MFRPSVETLESRTVPSLLVTGAGEGGGPEVHVYGTTTGALESSFLAFRPEFRGGVRVAVSGDQIIAAAGPGGGPQVGVFSKDGQLLSSFFAFAPSFTGGVFVAADKDRLVCGADQGGGPQVSVFDYSGKLLSSFFAFAPNFTGGVRVAVEEPWIVCGAGPGGQAVISRFTVGGKIHDSRVVQPHFTGGVFVGAGDVNNNGKPDVLVTLGPSRDEGPQVQGFEETDLEGFGVHYALPTSFQGGSAVAWTRNWKDQGAVVWSAAGKGGSPQLAALGEYSVVRNRTNQAHVVDAFFAYAPGFRGGLWVAGE